MSPEDITKVANLQAHEVALNVDPGLYQMTYERIFNFLYQKLLSPDADETPGDVDL